MFHSVAIIPVNKKKTVECQILTNHYAKSIEFLRSLFVDFDKYSL